jgi:hypothetical protein
LPPTHCRRLEILQTVEAPYEYQCYQCQDLGVELEALGCQECSCKEQCEENCRSKTYFTADQIFYIPQFFTMMWQLEQILKDDLAKKHYKINDNNKNNLFSWASKLQNVALEVPHMMEDDGESIKAALSKLTSLKKLYLVWRSIR